MRHAAAIAAIVLLSAVPAAAEQVMFRWEVLERFRPIRGGAEQARFYREFKAYMTAAECRAWGDPISLLRCPRFAELTTADYPTTWDPTTAQYDIGWLHDRRRRIALSLVAHATQPFGVMCRWEIDGQLLGSRACRGAEAQVELGRHRVRVRAAAGEGRPFGESAAEIDVKDILIVSIGDSFASGEGNPHVLWRVGGGGPSDGQPTSGGGRPAQWWDHRCHRSLISGPAFAAARLAQQRSDASVTFISYTCSGAEVKEGLVKPYYGRETAQQMRELYENFGVQIPAGAEPYPDLLIPPQVEKAAEALCPPGQFDAGAKLCRAEARVPDYLLISTGGNEIRFGPIVRDFAFGCDNACRARLKTVLAEDFKALKDDFDLLDRAIEPLKAKAVIVTEYPDPTRDQKKRFCDDRELRSVLPLRPSFVPPGANIFIGIAAVNAQFAYDEILLPLNSLIREAANNHAWRVAPMAETTRTKGYCSTRRWFHIYNEAVAKQGNIVATRFKHPERDETIEMESFSPGAMHPNVFGHYAYANSILEQMR